MITIGNLVQAASSILIIGCPGSGKTSYLEQYHKLWPWLKPINLDYYNKFDWSGQVEMVLYDMERIKGCFAMEGVLGYRLLKHGFVPSLVIELLLSPEKLLQVYEQRGMEKYNHVKRMMREHERILAGLKNRPAWVKYKDFDFVHPITVN